MNSVHENKFRVAILESRSFKLFSSFCCIACGRIFEIKIDMALAAQARKFKICLYATSLKDLGRIHDVARLPRKVKLLRCYNSHVS